MIRPSFYSITRTNEDIQYPRLLGSNEEKGGHTVQLEQEQELQLPEQQLQEQGDMLMVVCWDGLNHERRVKYCLYRLRFVAWMEEEMWTGGGRRRYLYTSDIFGSALVLEPRYLLLYYSIPHQYPTYLSPQYSDYTRLPLTLVGAE